MVNVQIDMWKHGFQEDLYEIANLKIANVHTDMETHDAIYQCRLYDKKTKDYREVMVNHNRHEGVYVLLEKVFAKFNKKE